jgi:phosphatidylinositol alpha-1,6-mannosyltransferase
VNILLISGIFPPHLGGVSVVYEQLANHLGAELSVVAPTCADTSRESGQGRDYHITRVPFFEVTKASGKRGPVRLIIDMFKRLVVSRLSITSGLFRQIWRSKPAVVCIGQLSLYWAGALVKRITGSPIVFFIYGEELSLVDRKDYRRVSGRVGAFLKHRAIRALRKADAIVAVGRFGTANLLKIGVKEDRIKVIHLGVDHTRFSPGDRDPIVMQRHGLKDKLVLLTLARLDRRKGQDKVILAMPAILKAIPNAVYVIAGDGPERERLENMVKELALQSSVIFAGRIPDDELCAYYRTCDLFVHPNRTMPDGDTEGFGLVFLEAGACAKPVIGGNTGGVPDAVVHGSTGLLVDGESHLEVAEAVIRILSNPELANMLAANGREWSNRFRWESTARKLRNLCVELTSTNDIAESKLKGTQVSQLNR